MLLKIRNLEVHSLRLVRSLHNIFQDPGSFQVSVLPYLVCGYRPCAYYFIITRWLLHPLKCICILALKKKRKGGSKDQKVCVTFDCLCLQYFSRLPSSNFHLHLTVQNSVMWLPKATEEAGCCQSCSSGSRC